MKKFNFLILLLALTLLQACSYVRDTFDRETGIKQTHIIDNSWFAPSTKYSMYFQCDPVGSSGFSEEADGSFQHRQEGKNCTPIDKQPSATGGIFPAIAGTGASLGSAAIISGADWGSNTTNNNANVNANKNSNRAVNRGSRRHR